MSTSISHHYEQSLDSDRIIQQLQAAYPQGPNQFQLAPVDQLHIGGIKASIKLVERIQLLDAKSILDIGSGLGGLMRLMETTLNAEIIGLDISQGLNKLNQRLYNLKPNLATPHIVTGDAHDLPFADKQFDLILLQHSLLNMPDDLQVLKECQRVLGENGAIIMHEVLQGDNHAAMVYPVPWARDPSSSHLISENEITTLLSNAGFHIDSLSDWSEEALAWRKRQTEKEQQSPVKAPPISPEMILGAEFKIMGGNVMKNLARKSARVVEIVARK